MTKVVIDMAMSLDGFVAGPWDGKEAPYKHDVAPIGASIQKEFA